MILRKVLDLVTGTRRALYIRIGRNSLTVRDAYSGKTLSGVPESPFTTRRLLVGDFVSASRELEKLVRQLYSNSIVPIRAPAVVHPLEMVEDGLSPVEHRVLLELTETAHSQAVAIHTGRELADTEVKELARKMPLQSGA